MDEKGQSGPGQACRKATVTLYERGEPKSISEWKTLWGMGNQTNITFQSNEPRPGVRGYAKWAGVQVC